MNKYFNIGFVILALCAVFGTAAAATDDVGSETRTIDARVVRVKLDGLIDLKLKQGPVAMLVLSGKKELLAKATTVQNGDTINIGTESHHFNFGGRRSSGLHAELTLPNLREVTSESVGTTEISGFSGDELELALEGAGSMKVNCRYRLVTASLGGVGSMNIQGGDGDGIDLNLRGAGYVTLAGRSKWLKANMGGLGGLDAQKLDADAVNLELSGLGNATVQASKDANLSVSGLGSVTVYGKPLNRSVSVDGLGKVRWK